MSTTKKSKAASSPQQFVLPAAKDASARAGETLAAAPTSRAPGRLFVDPELGVESAALLRREAEAVRRLGDRLALLAATQSHLLAELREVAVAGARSAEPLAQQPIVAILDWCDAVVAEIAAEGENARQGMQPVDLLVVCQDVAHALAGRVGDRHVIVSGVARHAVWGRATLIGRLVRQAVELVADRIGGWSDVHLTVAEDDDVPTIRVHGQGDVLSQPAADQVDAFRATAAASGFLVQPDESGPGGAGMLLVAGPGMPGPRID